ncbi:glutathionylspermidine synthase family protein [Flavisolibacter tropicus]|uniref:Glutathionylspermidine synthase pre-ATP-grasp-like domain-containing protein n=1 Tax=Flavisolibacter tropicus TaxID=1492898 RepID=A0A172TWL9_9BACT|nr:glutathionylspermidine synthase family protein [Flavisolibacter tropicus]ANE51368.1 hypothetical protein SY85_13460 [Flavisolibacter tropicus]
MKRLSITPRPHWQTTVQEQGFVFYKDYYNETAAYEFSADEVDQLESATAEIFDMCLAVVEHVIQHQLWDQFFIPKAYAELITHSWKEDAISFYGRMDLAYDGKNIKLLEFNADTPTSLLEASVIQWYWLQEHNKALDQFNSIHEKLMAHMKVCQEYFLPGKLFFACSHDSEEDFITTKYLEDVAQQTGIDTAFLYINEVGVDDRELFCTPQGEIMRNIFKLYPWEWMFGEEFGRYLAINQYGMNWIEPPYKAILSNKMVLKYLHDLFPNSPYILPCAYGQPLSDSYVRKPVYSREGANAMIVHKNVVLEETSGEYGEEGYIFQEYFPIPKHNGQTPVIGSWLIGGVPAGMGIRESSGLITGNTSLFCPHYFVPR